MDVSLPKYGIVGFEASLNVDTSEMLGKLNGTAKNASGGKLTPRFTASLFTLQDG